MVRVISVHHFAHQHIQTVEQPTASTVARNRLLLALSNHSVEVRDLTSTEDDNSASQCNSAASSTATVLFSFPTVDAVTQLVHCLNGNYVATVETKYNRQNRELCFVRVYVNWDSVATWQQSKMTRSGVSLGMSECGMVQPMRARIAGRVTPTTNQSELGSLEMIEIPTKRNPGMIAVCQISGNLLILSQNIITIYEFRIKLHDISKLRFIDFEEFPILIELHFIPTKISLCENYIACMNTEFMHMFRVMFNANGKEMMNESFSVDDLNFNYSHDDCIDYRKLQQEERLKSPKDKITVNLPSIVKENSAIHKSSPFTVCDKSMVAFIRSTSPIENRSQHFSIVNLIQIRLRTIVIENGGKQITEEFKCLELKPLYIDEQFTRKKTNENGKHLRSEFNHLFHSISCLIVTQQEGYMYQFSDSDISENIDHCISVYPFTAPVLQIVLEDYFLHAITEAGLESYTLRTVNQLCNSLEYLDDISSTCPPINESICLVGLRPFLGVEQILLSDNYLILLATADSSPTHSIGSSTSSTTASYWTMYNLQLPSPKLVYQDISIVANSHRFTSAQTYCHLLSEAHMIVRTNLLLKKFAPIEIDIGSVTTVKSNLEDVVEIYRNSCALLGDHYIMCTLEKDYALAVAYYKMGRVNPHEVLSRVKKIQEQSNNHNVSGLIHYLHITLLDVKFISEIDRIFNVTTKQSLIESILVLFTKHNYSSLPRLILKSRAVREYSTEKLITLLLQNNNQHFNNNNNNARGNSSNNCHTNSKSNVGKKVESSRGDKENVNERQKGQNFEIKIEKSERKTQICDRKLENVEVCSENVETNSQTVKIKTSQVVEMKNQHLNVKGDEIEVNDLCENLQEINVNLHENNVNLSNNRSQGTQKNIEKSQENNIKLKGNTVQKLQVTSDEKTQVNGSKQQVDVCDLQIDSAKSQIDRSKSKIVKIDSSKLQIDRTQFEDIKIQIDGSNTEIDSCKSPIDLSKTENDSCKTQIDGTKSQHCHVTSKSQIDSSTGQFDNSKSNDSFILHENNSKIQTDSSKKQTDSCKILIDSSKTQIDRSKSQNSNLTSHIQLDSSNTQIDSSKSQNSNLLSKTKLDSSKSQSDSSKSQTDNFKPQTDNCKTQIDNSKAQLFNNFDRQSSAEKSLALTILYLQRSCYSTARSCLETLDRDVLRELLTDVWELLFDGIQLTGTTRKCGQQGSFTELAGLVMTVNGDVLAEVFVYLVVVRKCVTLTKLLKVFIDYLPSSNGTYVTGSVLQSTIELYLRHFYSRYENRDQSKIVYDRATHEALKLLVRSYLSQLQLLQIRLETTNQSMNENHTNQRHNSSDDSDTTRSRHNSRNSTELFLFAELRYLYLNEMPPFEVELTAKLRDRSNKSNKSSEISMNVEVNYVLRKLQALLCSQALPNQVIIEVNTFLGLNENLRGNVSLQSIIMTVNDAVLFLIEECPQCLQQFAKDRFTKIDEWKFLVANIQRHIIVLYQDKEQHRVCFFFKKILKDTLTYVATNMTLEHLVEVFPQHMQYSTSCLDTLPSSGVLSSEVTRSVEDTPSTTESVAVDILSEIQNYEPYINMCKESMHANQIKKLITATGQQLLSTLNL